MKVSIQEIAKGNKNLVLAPFEKGRSDELNKEERETLSKFSGLSLDIEPEALPLEVFLGGGSRQHLGIFPAQGAINISVPVIQIHDENRTHEIIINKYPFPYREG